MFVLHGLSPEGHAGLGLSLASLVLVASSKIIAPSPPPRAQSSRDRNRLRTHHPATVASGGLGGVMEAALPADPDRSFPPAQAELEPPPARARPKSGRDRKSVV